MQSSSSADIRICTKCGQGYPATTEYFHAHPQTKIGLRPSCKPCRTTYERELQRRKRFKTRERKYGLTELQFREMLTSQDFGCAICRRPISFEETRPGRGVAIDHCHSTGRVRGLLCNSCNLGLGKFCDDPTVLKAAIEYLERKIAIW